MKLIGQLIASFDAKPLLATYVHSLKLRVRWMIQSQPHEDEMRTAANRVISRLTNVKELLFFVVYWGKLPALLKASFIDLIRAPSLTRISFTGFSMPTFTELVSVLSHAKHAKVLHIDLEIRYIHDVPFLESETRKTSQPPRSIQLNELTLGVEPRYITWFQKDWCPFEVRNLQMLRFTMFGSSIETIGLVKLAGGNLRELQLTDSKLSSRLCILFCYLYSVNIHFFRLEQLSWIHAQPKYPFYRCVQGTNSLGWCCCHSGRLQASPQSGRKELSFTTFNYQSIPPRRWIWPGITIWHWSFRTMGCDWCTISETGVCFTRNSAVRLGF